MSLLVEVFTDPLNGQGYQFWSGIGSDIGEITLIGLGFAWLHHHNCYERGCWRVQWHPHPVHGHPVCKRHHPDYSKGNK
jgi:hypothetical protein